MAVKKEGDDSGGRGKVFEGLKGLAAERERLKWTGSFAEYLEMVAENPNLARNAYMLVHQMSSAPDFFEKADDPVFGAEKAVEKWGEIAESAAEGGSTGSRIILFFGPPGSGKSTMIAALKRGEEKFTRTEAGAVYAIADCPMWEDSLHLIPHELRGLFEEEYGVRISGDLCPHCALKYGDGNLDTIMGTPVKRIFFSERDKVGVATVAPSDPKSQDIADFVGTVDFSKLGEHGTAKDPRAFRFDGKIEVANRGILECKEMLKIDEKFLYIFLSLAQERLIEVPGFADISADLVVVAATNQAEYESFSANSRNEALMGRMLVISVPYSLVLSTEEKIYETKIYSKYKKLLSETGEGGSHIVSPHTLKLAAMFAVLSRLETSKRGVNSIKKMKLYDGEYVEGSSDREAEELRKEFPREGMTGVSPRYVMDTLVMAIARHKKKGDPCLTPFDALRALKDGFEDHMDTRNLPATKKEQLLALITEVRKEFDVMAQREVQGAFINAFEAQARTLFSNYLDQVDAYCNKRKLRDPITGEDIEPDEKFMRSIEEQVKIGESGKAEFRREALTKMIAALRNGVPFDYKMHPTLKEAIETKLFADSRNFVKLVTSSRTPDKDQQEKLTEVESRLIEKGYCPHCAKELIRYVGTLLNR